MSLITAKGVAAILCIVAMMMLSFALGGCAGTRALYHAAQDGLVI